MFVAGIILTIFLIIYFRDVVNPVDSEPMSIKPGGGMSSEWPLFIGIIFTFVGVVFYYVSDYKKGA